MAYLECNGLKKAYSEFTLDLSLSMDKGELLCIIGPSGSGKSTLLSLLSGIESPDEGRILIDSQDITDMPIQKRQIGMVFQDFSLFPSLDVQSNIQFGMKGKTKIQKELLADQLLDMVGLPDYGKRRVHELSGGEAQRIALARAIAAEPRILLLDEPLSALDAPLRKRLRTIIRQIHDKTGITMLYVTHDREEAFAIADRIMILKGGKVEDIGSPEDIYRHPRNLFCAFFTGEGSSIPSNIVQGIEPGTQLFFRPEDISLGEHFQENGDIVLHDALVQNAEYTGSGYTVRLSFRGCAITAYTKTKPEKTSMDILVPRESASLLV